MEGKLRRRLLRSGTETATRRGLVPYIGVLDLKLK